MGRRSAVSWSCSAPARRICNFSQQQQASHDLLISNQVSKGFEQLGNKDAVVVRLGGIYALEGVMNSSDQYHRPVLEALTAFVRDGTLARTPSSPADNGHPSCPDSNWKALRQPESELDREGST